LSGPAAFHVKQITRCPPIAPLSPEEFRGLTAVTKACLSRLETYVDMLIQWQRRVNLVSTASLSDVWRRHFLDSAQLHDLLPAAAKTVIDLGSGAGFPGLVLAIMGGPTVHLVESNGRKCAFLEAANRATEAGAVIHNARVSELEPIVADVVTARAFAPLPRLLEAAQPLLAEGGSCLILKGRKVNEELTESAKTWIMKTTRFNSSSDPSGTILKLEEISRHHDH
jgi:16S rRNA (guanine527-N7)-methyltransferase